jgi:hypothetical protein
MDNSDGSKPPDENLEIGRIERSVAGDEAMHTRMQGVMRDTYQAFTQINDEFAHDKTAKPFENAGI